MSVSIRHLAKSIAGGLLACWLTGVRADNSVYASKTQIDPGVTGPANAAPQDQITPYGYGQHYVVVPKTPNGSLFLFLGGTHSVPGEYLQIVNQAASAGFLSVGLAYPDSQILTNICVGSNRCFEGMRGETAFGWNVRYTATMLGYQFWPEWDIAVSRGNSIVNRLVCLIDYLAQSDSATWAGFLIPSKLSPYPRPSDGVPVYPDWSKIVLAGHSQGGGEAAFMAMNLPVAAKGVVLLSGPEDTAIDANGNSVPANWIKAASTTPMSRWYGMRHGPGTVPTADSNEGQFGADVHANWLVLGGSGLIGNGDGTDTPIIDGSGDPGGSHRLFINRPYGLTHLVNHDSTAKDLASSPTEYPAWAYMISGGITAGTSGGTPGGASAGISGGVKN